MLAVATQFRVFVVRPEAPVEPVPTGEPGHLPDTLHEFAGFQLLNTGPVDPRIVRVRIKRFRKFAAMIGVQVGRRIRELSVKRV
jgi:hypothetical protein